MLLTDQHIKQGVLEGLIPSAAWDTTCMSHTRMVGDPFIQTERTPTIIFTLADGHPTPATTIALLEHKVREPACTVNMVPSLSN